MRKVMFLLNFLLTVNLVGNSFDYLEEKAIDTLEVCDSMIIKIIFNKSCSQIIDTMIHSDYEDAPMVTHILRTKIDSCSDLYYNVYFSGGPSCDPSFSVKKEELNTHGDDTIETIPEVTLPGTQLIIPGDGNLYPSGHVNNEFNHKKKYTLKNSKWIEVKQPFYSVNIRTKCLTPIILYSDINLEDEVARLPEETEVDIILENDGLYLIRTSFGILGWVNVEMHVLEGVTFKEIYPRGD